MLPPDSEILCKLIPVTAKLNFKSTYVFQCGVGLPITVHGDKAVAMWVAGSTCALVGQTGVLVLDTAMAQGKNGMPF